MDTTTAKTTSAKPHLVTVYGLAYGDANDIPGAQMEVLHCNVRALPAGADHAADEIAARQIIDAQTPE